MKRKAAPGDSVELKYDIVPANASSFAADIVQDAKNISGAVLDYSVESLVKVDELIEGFRKEGRNGVSSSAIAVHVFLSRMPGRWPLHTP